MDAGWLRPAERQFLEAARRAVLATADPRGLPRPVPICFALEPVAEPQRPACIWTPLDEKPKATADPLALARVRDIQARPGVALLVDRWSEAWDQLAWLRLTGAAAIAGPDHPGHPTMVTALRARYPQYASQALEGRPMIRIVIEAVTSWGLLEPAIRA